MSKKWLFSLVVGLIAVVLLTSCTAPASTQTSQPAPAVKNPETIPAIIAVPNDITLGATTTYLGADFAPKSIIRVVIQYSPNKDATPVEVGALATTDELGTFSLGGQFVSAGIYTVRAYTQDGTLLATTAIRVKAPAK